MAYKYFYIDDMPDKVKGIIAGLYKKDELEILFHEPEGVWETEIDGLAKARKENKYQGIILDLRLQDQANSKKVISRYRGSSLAQELRILAKENSFADCPIILLSATDNLNASMDQTSKDLFDLIIEKDNLSGDSYPYEYAQLLLVSLAKGYETLSQKGAINDIFSLDISFVDKRLIQDLISIHANKPTHILAGFIIKQLLIKTGPLININLLAARLGVDIEQSKEEWHKLLGLLDGFRFKGVFSDGWERWWNQLVEKWWIENFPDKILRIQNASDRVKSINEKFGIGLIAIQKTERSKSEKFWVVCKGTGRAIDPTDGFIVGDQDNLYPWQEKEYISVDEALTREHVSIWKEISYLDKSRFEKLVKSIE